MFRFLRRNLKIINSSIKERAYKAVVQLMLKYTSSFWDPHTQKNISRDEAVQRRAASARFVLNRYRNTSSVNSMLEALDWPTLERRCQISRLSMLYKIHSGLVHCPCLKSKLTPLPSSQCQGHEGQFKLIPAKDTVQVFFLHRTIKDWNRLPKEVVEATMLDTFVSRASSL